MLHSRSQHDCSPYIRIITYSLTHSVSQSIKTNFKTYVGRLFTFAASTLKQSSFQSTPETAETLYIYSVRLVSLSCAFSGDSLPLVYKLQAYIRTSEYGMRLLKMYTHEAA